MIKIIDFLKIEDKMSQLKNRRAKNVNFLKVDNKISQLKELKS